MHRPSTKLLCLWTALLLALSPLQGVANGLPDDPEIQDASMLFSVLSIENTTVSIDMAPGQSCDECNTEENCFSYNCTLAQCANCAVVLSSSSRISLPPVARQMIHRFDEGPARLLLDSLFRPPKI